MQESQQGEPGAPQQHLVDVLDVDDAKHEDELVEDEVPEPVLEVLLLGDAQLAEDELLHAPTHQHQEAERHVYHGLEEEIRNWLCNMMKMRSKLIVVCLRRWSRVQFDVLCLSQSTTDLSYNPFEYLHNIC